MTRINTSVRSIAQYSVVAIFLSALVAYRYGMSACDCGANILDSQQCIEATAR